jgi:hypothetical protein
MEFDRYLFFVSVLSCLLGYTAGNDSGGKWDGTSGGRHTGYAVCYVTPVSGQRCGIAFGDFMFSGDHQREDQKRGGTGLYGL